MQRFKFYKDSSSLSTELLFTEALLASCFPCMTEYESALVDYLNVF